MNKMKFLDKDGNIIWISVNQTANYYQMTRHTVTKRKVEMYAAAHGLRRAGKGK